MQLRFGSAASLAVVSAETILLPNFIEPIAFALVVAKNVNSIILPQPSMQLREELAPLHFRYLRIRRALRQGPMGIQTFEVRNAESGVRNGRRNRVGGYRLYFSILLRRPWTRQKWRLP